jgi:hypothetical protein
VIAPPSNAATTSRLEDGGQARLGQIDYRSACSCARRDWIASSSARNDGRHRSIDPDTAPKDNICLGALCVKVRLSDTGIIDGRLRQCPQPWRVDAFRLRGDGRLEDENAAFFSAPTKMVLGALALATKHQNFYISPDIYCFFPGGELYVNAITKLQDQFIFATLMFEPLQFCHRPIPWRD